MLSSRTSWIRAYAFIPFLILSILAYEGIATSSNYQNRDVAVYPYRIVSAPSRRIFAFRRNGIKVDIKAVPAPKNESSGSEDEENFPEFPTGEIGQCVLQFSLVCAKKRVNHFLDSIKELNEITLLGQDVKLVKTRVKMDDRIANDSDVSIQRSIDDFFETFALRITLPKWRGKRERNQIDVMLDETALAEGRKKGGGGKGGGGKCKMMMMAMVLMVKMKIMGFMAMKSMMMAGMSLMFTTFMLGQKFMKGGGPWQSGGGGPWQDGGGGGGGGGKLKEIVLLTKASGGGNGGGGGCCGGGGGDSYGAPPPPAYGAPSGGGYGGGGGGYGGGGGGWGRSFTKRQMIGHDESNRPQYADSSNLLSIIAKPNHVNYSDYTVQRTNKTLHNWNATNYGSFDSYQYFNDRTDSESDSVNQPISDLVSTKGNQSRSNTEKYITEDEPLAENIEDSEIMNPLERGVVDEPLNTNPQNMKSPIYVVESNTAASSSPVFLANTNRPDLSLSTNVMRPAYNDEWEATDERIVPINALPAQADIRSTPTVPINRVANTVDLALDGI